MSLTGKKRGRKSKPYLTSWGEHIDGLYHRRNGRWRVIWTGHIFSEADERAAVARFRQLTQSGAVKMAQGVRPIAPPRAAPIINRATKRALKTN